jgi:DNA-binding NarL/FixJ family response regulator
MHAITPADCSKLHANGWKDVFFKGAQPMKILVVGYHFLIREVLRGIIKEIKGDAVVLDAVDDTEAMERLSEEADIHLVILDLDLPNRTSLSSLYGLRGHYPELPVVVVSGAQDHDIIMEALDHGARGFLFKSGDRRIMLLALELVFVGGIYIPSEILAAERCALGKPMPRQDTDGPPQFTPADLGLTGRQLDVLAAMMQGKCNKAICRDLNLAITTVKNHVGAIFRQLRVSSRVEAVLTVSALGWQQPKQERGSARAGGVKSTHRIAAHVASPVYAGESFDIWRPDTEKYYAWTGEHNPSSRD